MKPNCGASKNGTHFLSTPYTLASHRLKACQACEANLWSAPHFGFTGEKPQECIRLQARIGGLYPPTGEARHRRGWGVVPPYRRGEATGEDRGVVPPYRRGEATGEDGGGLYPHYRRDEAVHQATGEDGGLYPPTGEVRISLRVPDLQIINYNLKAETRRGAPRRGIPPLYRRYRRG